MSARATQAAPEGFLSANFVIRLTAFSDLPLARSFSAFSISLSSFSSAKLGLVASRATMAMAVILMKTVLFGL